PGGQVSLRKEVRSRERRSCTRTGAPSGTTGQLVSHGNEGCSSAGGALSKIKKRRRNEITKSSIRFSGNDGFVRKRGVGTAGEDRLRSRRQLRPIQDLFVEKSS